MNELDRFLDQAWADHADQPGAVAARLPQGLAAVVDDDGVMRLAMLIHHVLGEHLGRWQDGLALLTGLAARGVQGPAGAAALARCAASLRLSEGSADERAALDAGDACRVTAMAAGNLAQLDSARAAGLLEQAVAQAAALADGDPGVRTVAAQGNGIAATLQELASLEPPQRALMIRAAEVARTHWERAGTWLEVERAEYRLALCWLAAGDAKRGLEHGRLCEAIVRDHGSQPLELFFAGEALGLPARQLGDAATEAAAVAMSQQAFEDLPSEDQAWCRPTLDKLLARP